MATRTWMNSLLGVKIPVEGPADEETYNQMSGDPDACMSAAMSQAFYRYYNGDVRPLVAEKLEEVTGIKRRQDTRRTKKVKGPDGEMTEEPILITEQVFVNELLESNAITEDQLEKVVLEVAAAYGPIRITPDTGRSSKPAKQWMEQATAILAGMDAGTFKDANGQPVSVEAFQDQWSSLNGQPFSNLGEWSKETLARALQLNDARKQRAAASVLSL